jgi:hypothetical protein
MELIFAQMRNEVIPEFVIFKTKSGELLHINALPLGRVSPSGEIEPVFLVPEKFGINALWSAFQHLKKGPETSIYALKSWIHFVRLRSHLHDFPKKLDAQWKYVRCFDSAYICTEFLANKNLANLISSFYSEEPSFRISKAMGSTI